MKIKLLYSVIVTLISVHAFSQHPKKREISVSLYLKNRDTLIVVPNGSADFISKISSYKSGDTLYLSVYRWSRLSLLFSWTHYNSFFSKERQEQIKGILPLNKEIFYIQTFEHTWKKKFNKGRVELVQEK